MDDLENLSLASGSVAFAEIADNNIDDTEPFQKEKRSPPPQYHIESSRGDVKDRVD